MANITNNDELVETIQDLTKALTIPDGTFDKKMDATTTNTLFNAVEDSFNALYVKLRELEDLHDFTKKYIEHEFEKNRTMLADAVNKINTTADLYEDTTVRAMNLSFKNGTVLQDRDGSPIGAAITMDGVTVLPSNATISQVSPSSTNTVSNDMPYRQVKLPADQYRSFYALETPAKDGIEENIYFMLPKKATVNFVRLSAFNSSVEEVNLIRYDDELIPLKEAESALISGKDIAIEPIVIKGITIKLKSNAVSPITLSVSEVADQYLSMKPVYTQSLLNTIFETFIAQKGDAIGVYKQDN